MSTNNINEEGNLEAKLINKNSIVSLSHKKISKKDIIITFENGETFSIPDALYKVSYKVYND